MTGNEKYDPRLRIYHAEPPSAPGENGGRGAAAFCLAAALLFSALLPEDIRGGLINAAAAVSRVSAAFGQGKVGIYADGAYYSPESPSEPAKPLFDISAMAEEDMLMLSKGSRRMPSSYDEEKAVEDSPPAADTDFLADYPDNDGRITQMTYQRGSGSNYIDLPMGGQIRNATSLPASEIKENALLLPDIKIKLNAPENEPQVLIMHTHTTESYEPDERGYYDADYIGRTTDDSRNMNAVGEVMAQALEAKGIRVLHDTTVHDHPSYNGSYDRSRVTVQELLEKYPSIRVVLDVHRDAIERDNGERIAPAAVIDGKSCAQVMIICGCDDGTMGMPGFMKNLRTAALFQQYMEKEHSGLTRPVLFDYRKYNQDLTTGSLLIEVGGHANSLEQALYAGRLTAESIGDALTENCLEE